MGSVAWELSELFYSQAGAPVIAGVVARREVANVAPAAAGNHAALGCAVVAGDSTIAEAGRQPSATPV